MVHTNGSEEVLEFGLKSANYSLKEMRVSGVGLADMEE